MAHEFEKDDFFDYGCKHCGSRYHCAACNEGSGQQGHSMSDKDGVFFSCQEPERARRNISRVLRAI